MKKLALLLTPLALSFGLEFGSMGNTSISMGGAGVALQHSAFGSYYNPALISIDNKFRFGYSIGARYEQKNIDKLQKINWNGATPPLDADTKQALEENFLKLTSQNGIAMQISPAAMRGTFGSLGLAVYSSLFSAGVFYDPNTKPINGKPKDTAVLHSLLLTEVPVSYAKTFFMRNTNLNIGLTLKYLHASFAREFMPLGDITMNKIISTLPNRLTRDGAHNFGVDLGMSFGIDLPKFNYLQFGFVAKNVNAPTFNFDGDVKVKIKPQYRVGIAYNQPYVTFAIDADLLPNETFTFNPKNQKSQMIGGGLKFDLKAIDMRIGAMYDIRQDYGLVLTTGLNIFGLFDIAFQIGTKGDTTFMPRYMALQLGGGFSF